jgi:uncharacterized protein YkwD
LNRLRLPFSLVLLCVLLALAVPTAGSARPPAGKRMVDGINWSRASQGLRPLRVSRRLSRSAAAHARGMLRVGVFAHPARLRVPGFDRVGEVLELHSGRRPKPGRALRRWAHSPPHRQILLSSRFRHVGVAYARGRIHGFRATVWVVRTGSH